jgi:hypothetical protein
MWAKDTGLAVFFFERRAWQLSGTKHCLCGIFSWGLWILFFISFAYPHRACTLLDKTMHLVGGGDQGTFSRDSCVVDCICGGDDPSVDMTWTLGTCKSLSSSAVLLSSLMVCSQVSFSIRLRFGVLRSKARGHSPSSTKETNNCTTVYHIWPFWK